MSNISGFAAINWIKKTGLLLQAGLIKIVKLY